MKINEIKKLIVTEREYIAEDGTIFREEEECKKYEKSALFEVNKRLKRLNTQKIYQDQFNDQCSSDEEMEIFDIQTEEDLENLKKYIYLTLSQNGSTEKDIKQVFTADTEDRKNFVIDNLTSGHEVLLFWGYDRDWCWVYKDGSVKSYCDWIQEQYQKLITPKEKQEKKRRIQYDN